MRELFLKVSWTSTPSATHLTVFCSSVVPEETDPLRLRAHEGRQVSSKKVFEGRRPRLGVAGKSGREEFFYEKETEKN